MFDQWVYFEVVYLCSAVGLFTADVLTLHSGMSAGVAKNINTGSVIQVSQCDSEPTKWNSVKSFCVLLFLL